MAIAKQLAKKTIGDSTTKQQKQIGNQVSVLETEFTISVERVSKEKPIELCKCSVCGTEYQSNLASFAYTNYGGPVRRLSYCSDACADAVASALPGRIARKKSEVHQSWLY